MPDLHRPERPSSFSRYYVQATLVCAWCELRNDIRHFRTDPIVATAVLDEPFKIPDAVIAAWAAERDDQ
jgi:predicted DNA-binding transcriptional regulator YafY